MEKSGMEPNQPRKESPSSIASTELRQSVSQATERIQEVIDTAEQVAVQITAEAEEQAGQQLAQAKAEAAQAKAEASGPRSVCNPSTGWWPASPNPPRASRRKRTRCWPS